MQQLTKIHRVIGKQIPEAPHEVLLVLDATTGQNGISQAKHFTEAVNCTGIVLAKLDGTAKGGVVVAIRQQVGLPVKYVGVGEKPKIWRFSSRRLRRGAVCRLGEKQGLPPHDLLAEPCKPGLQRSHPQNVEERWARVIFRVNSRCLASR